MQIESVHEQFPSPVTAQQATTPTTIPQTPLNPLFLYQLKVDKLAELDKKKEMSLKLLVKAEKALRSIDSIINEESPELFLKNKDKVMSDVEPILSDLKFI